MEDILVQLYVLRDCVHSDFSLSPHACIQMTNPCAARHSCCNYKFQYQHYFVAIECRCCVSSFDFTRQNILRNGDGKKLRHLPLKGSYHKQISIAHISYFG